MYSNSISNILHISLISHFSQHHDSKIHAYCSGVPLDSCFYLPTYYLGLHYPPFTIPSLSSRHPGCLMPQCCEENSCIGSLKYQCENFFGLYTGVELQDY